MTKLLNLDYPQVLDLFKEYSDPKRTESASFIIWYLENYYRLDPLEAIDSVCDQRGDKGVDGIYVNNNDETIDIFQCKLSQSKDSTIGDTPLKEFFGTLSQFINQASIEKLVASAGDAEIARLIKRLDLAAKVNTYDVRGIFISNIHLDKNGKNCLDTIPPKPQILFVGKQRLIETYISDERALFNAEAISFDIAGFRVSEYIVDANTKSLIAPIKAKELIALKGISDQSLFALNVRGPLGRTKVNRDIVKSIKDRSKHKLFPLFHNGITIICSRIVPDKDKITIENYHVVNGCQSLNSLYENKSSLTEDLRILTKFVQVKLDSELPEMVTSYSNNQNAVKPRDSKANDPIQIRLQNEFKKNYKSEYWYEIKRGEIPEAPETISNEQTGLLLMSFDLGEPWGTHRKYQVFEEKHTELFGRPSVSSDRVVMLHEMMKVIASLSGGISNTLFGKYAITRQAMLYMLRNTLETDPLGRGLMADPSPFVRSKTEREDFIHCINTIVNDMVVDINAEVKDLEEDFDYRGKLRDEEWVKDLSKKVVGNYQKLVQRDRIESFEKQWSQRKQEKK